MKEYLQEFEIPQDFLESWQEILDIIAEVVEVPAALIMRLSDPDIEVLVASQSTGNPYHPGDKEHFWGSGLYCETVIRENRKLHVPDALADSDWANNPDVKLSMISYLGFPLLLPDEQPFGTICVLDTESNQYSAVTERLMMKFRSLIEANLEMIFMNQVLGEDNKRLTDYLSEIQALRGMVPICSSCKAIKDENGKWHPVEHYLIRHPKADFSHGICPVCMKKLYPDYDRGA